MTWTCEDGEFSIRFLYEVTLAQLEAAGVELEGGFGIDREEHAAMAHEEGLLRAVAGWDLESDGEITPTFDVECFQGRLSRPAPAWESCLARYRHPSGAVERNRRQQNYHRLMALLTAADPELCARLSEAHEKLARCLEA